MQSLSPASMFTPSVIVEEALHADDIRPTLLKLLHIPDRQLKTRIATEIAAYFGKRFSEKSNAAAAFVATRAGVPVGFVSCSLDPHYRSYGRKCATFGWLFAPDADTCEGLLFRCEQFAREHKHRLLRGPINHPKGVGGIGLQVRGFNQQMLYGVAFGRPRSRLKYYLVKSGYEPDTSYACVEVSERTWQSEKKILKEQNINDVIKIKQRKSGSVSGWVKDIGVFGTSRSDEKQAISPDTLFENYFTEVKTWVESGYDPATLDHYRRTALLFGLAKIGDQKAIARIREEAFEKLGRNWEFSGNRTGDLADGICEL